MSDTNEELILAQTAYAAYGETTGWKNFQGNPMPAWEQLGEPIQKAWIAAAQAVYSYLMGPPALDELSPGLTD